MTKHTMKPPKLIARMIAHPDGRVVFPEDWWEYPATVRADLLSDWIYELRVAQVEAIESIGTRAQQLVAGYDLEKEEPPQQRKLINGTDRQLRRNRATTQ
jgi:hypothetical protein